MEGYSLEPEFPGTAAIDVPKTKTVGPGSDITDDLQVGHWSSNHRVPTPPPLPLRTPATPIPGPAREKEPWYYIFLDRYATIVTRVVLGLSVAILFVGTLAYLYRLYGTLTLEHRLGAGFGSLLLTSGITTLYFLACVVVFVLFFLVPVLFALSLVHVVVDAARNLRSIHASLAKKE
jgi:hypothetical protein